MKTVTNAANQEYDSPWKDILEAFFPQFMAFFFAEAHRQIDWRQGYVFLDKEFQKIIRSAETGKRYVDKLVKVYLLNGQETWVLIHIEVQGEKETDFARRMFVYYYRIFDRYQRPLASLAVLSDDQADWRPSQFQQELFNCRVALDFPAIKLLDYERKMDQLSDDPNPFALVVMAHLQTLRTRRSNQDRYAAKLNLAKLLYRRGLTRDEIIKLFHFIDWVMTLPTDLDEQFQTELLHFEEEAKMQYVSGIERRAIERGLRKGLQTGALETGRKAIKEVLNARFGAASTAVADHLEQIDDEEDLRRLLRLAVTIESPEAFAEELAAEINQEKEDNN